MQMTKETNTGFYLRPSAHNPTYDFIVSKFNEGNLKIIFIDSAL